MSIYRQLVQRSITIAVALVLFAGLALSYPLFGTGLTADVQNSTPAMDLLADGGQVGQGGGG